MDILVACDSFKESLNATAVVQAITDGFSQVFPKARYHEFPMADGGEQTATIMARATGGYLESRLVCGPMGNSVEARFAIFPNGNTAVIELAEAAGLAQIPPESRSPLFATTYGVGELIRAALDLGCRHLVLALGGSATCDGGAGMLQALGIRLTDRHGEAVALGGGPLATLASLDCTELDTRLQDSRIEILCDVSAPLLGPSGTARVFGPQKGATPETIPILEKGLSRLCTLLEEKCCQSLAELAGMGAAGGTALGLVALCKADLVPGAFHIARLLGIDKLIKTVDLVITGEGRLDSQTAHGKAPHAIACLAKAHDKPVLAFAGTLGHDHATLHASGIDAVFSCLDRPCTLEEALQDTRTNLQRCARNVAQSLAIGRSFQRGQE